MGLENPKDAQGRTKVPMSMLPEIAQMEAALAMYEGSLKYGFRNYRYAPVRASVYTDALRRHLCKWESGEDHDPESHVHHLGNVMACAAILLDAAAHGTLIDDRDYSDVVATHIDAAKAVVKHLHLRYGTDTRLLPERESTAGICPIGDAHCEQCYYENGAGKHGPQEEPTTFVNCVAYPQAGEGPPKSSGDGIGICQHGRDLCIECWPAEYKAVRSEL